ncbi:hypothetical protein NMY22_g13108 [Coprinellus aureogranulatus]|nr:hypothetical protein NMY22_g13108 [Coprinellus aureogranulatus]
MPFERGSALEEYERGLALKNQFHGTSNVDHLNEAISSLRSAIDMPKEDSGALPDWLNTLGESLWFRSERTGSLSDIAEAISAFQRAIDLGSNGNKGTPLWMSNLAHVLHSRFQRTGDFRDVTEATSILQKAMEMTHEDDPSLLNILNNLGFTFQSRFSYSGNIADINEALSVQRKAVSLAPPESAALPIMLSNLGTTLQFRFKLTGDISDIMESISTLEQAAEVTPDGDPSLPTTISNLGLSRRYHSERTGDDSNLDEAILDFEEAIGLFPDGHANLPSCLSNLGLALQTRFQRRGRLDDITESISILQRAVNLTPEGHTLFPLILNNLGQGFHARFTSTGDAADISEAISVQQRAIALTPAGHSDLPTWHSNIGISFLSRFKATGDPQDIENSTESLRKAVDLTPKHHAGLANTLNNLGLSLRHRFERTGDLSHISDSIVALETAVSLAPEGHAHLPFWLSNLGLAFQSRYDDTGDKDDLTEALSAYRRSIALTPEGHASLPERLCNLGIALVPLFEHTRELSTISEAISAQRRAVSLTAAGHTSIPIMLSDLAMSLLSRFKFTHDLSDIDEAITTLQSAVDLTPDGHASKPTTINNLGLSFSLRYERASKETDIAKAISTLQKAVDYTPEGHADLPTIWYTLAKSLKSRAVSTGSRDDLDASIARFKLVATCTFAPPALRLEASTKWARDLRQFFPHSPETLTAYDTTVQLVAQMSGLHQTLQRRYLQLQGISSTAMSATEAAAVAFQLGHPDKAVEWLEHGRCLVWNQLSMLRTPVDELALHDLKLAERVTDVSRRLEHTSSSRGHSSPSMSLSQKISLEEDARVHLALAREWDDLLATVRSIPGFQSFLQAAPYSSLIRHLPTSGFVVILNAHGDRCDAVALSAGHESPLHINLPSFSPMEAARYARNLSAQLHTQGLRMRGEGDSDNEEGEVGRAMARFNRNKVGRKSVVHEVLRGLWDRLVKPILEALQIAKSDFSSANPLPRIWWCPTGPLAFLPIHAAGTYTDAGTESVLDYVVSSYIPTIGALTSRLRGLHNHSPNFETSGLFLTSQPKAPGASAIPGTTAEVGSIYDLALQMGVRAKKVDGDDVTVDECLNMMETFSSIHLACHASQHAKDPLRSRFLFHKGALELSLIVQRNLKYADLAFLSACQTSTGEETLSDEAVHLAAGMLAAGYQRVVATMWAISDRHAPDVAKEFYQYLWTKGKESHGGGFDGSHSAYALHHSIQRLRGTLDNSEGSILSWAAYVHFGY